MYICSRQTDCERRSSLLWVVRFELPTDLTPALIWLLYNSVVVSCNSRVGNQQRRPAPYMRAAAIVYADWSWPGGQVKIPASTRWIGETYRSGVSCSCSACTHSTCVSSVRAPTPVRLTTKMADTHSSGMGGFLIADRIAICKKIAE